MHDIFFYSSKLFWIIISPDNLFLVFLTAGIFLLFTRWQKKAKKLLLIMVFPAWLLALLPIGEWLFYPLESQYPSHPVLPDQIDGIIVLGGAVNPSLSQYWKQLETYSSHERLSEFILLAKQYPEARLVFTGGNASLRKHATTEAEQVKDYFIQSGINKNRLLLENEARNTYENAIYSKRLAQPASDENWILITSAYHMPRSMGVFCKQGWATIPYPVDHASQPDRMFTAKLNLSVHLFNLVEASHEWVGLLAYFVTGKSSQLLAKDCKVSPE
jgi:uncharacterized SAM-binding protein YcdF (DUF218 family)